MRPPPAPGLGDIVFRLREEADVSQWTVADRMSGHGHEWTAFDVAALERADRPKTSVAEFLALMDVLGADPVEVVNELVGCGP